MTQTSKSCPAQTYTTTTAYCSPLDLDGDSRMCALTCKTARKHCTLPFTHRRTKSVLNVVKWNYLWWFCHQIFFFYLMASTHSNIFPFSTKQIGILRKWFWCDYLIIIKSNGFNLPGRGGGGVGWLSHSNHKHTFTQFTRYSLPQIVSFVNEYYVFAFVKVKNFKTSHALFLQYHWQVLLYHNKTSHSINKTLRITGYTGYKHRLFSHRGRCFACKDLWYKKVEKQGLV